MDMMRFDPWGGSVSEYYDDKADTLLDRWCDLTGWFNSRAQKGLDPYAKSMTTRPAPEIHGFDRIGRALSGINFASEDHLGFASHPKVIAAAQNEMERLGVHVAGAASLMGMTDLTLELEARIAQFVELEHATVCASGWAAGFGTIRTLVKPGDYVLIDASVQPALIDAARSATAHVIEFSRLSQEILEARLDYIRDQDPHAGAMIVTEGLFGLDSDMPILSELRSLSDRYNATLLVDVSQDLGLIGATGRGSLELQNEIGKIDIVTGSFSRGFASCGGFVASNHPALKLALRHGSDMFRQENAMSPVQAAAVLACLEITASDEGSERRAKLSENARYLRRRLQLAGFDVLGVASPVVPVKLGRAAVSRQMTGHILSAGGIVNLVEDPAQGRNSCRWPLQVLAEHTQDQIDRFVKLAVEARHEGRLRVA